MPVTSYSPIGGERSGFLDSVDVVMTASALPGWCGRLVAEVASIYGAVYQCQHKRHRLWSGV